MVWVVIHPDLTLNQSGGMPMSSTSKKVVLWSKTGCHFCGEVKAFLTACNQSFENIEVQGNDVLRDVLEAKYGIRHVPVIEVGGDGKYEALLEPDLEKLAELLAQSDEAAV